MAIFSQDQVRQFYIANANKVAPLKETDTAGTIAVKSSPQDVWFEYVTPNGDNGNTVVRTDLINKNKITSITKTETAATRKLKKVTVAIDGEPTPGQEYIIRFVFYGLGIGGVENQYIKEGGVYKAKKADTAKDIYEGLLASIERNFSREAYPLINIGLNGTAATATMVTNAGVTVTAKEVGTAGNNLKFAVASVSAGTPGVAVSTVSGVTTITASLTATAKTIGDLKTLVESKTNLVTITGTAATDVSAETTAVALKDGTLTGIVIEEVLQPWVRGKRQAAPVNFDTFTLPIKTEDGEQPWGIVTDITKDNVNTVGNGRMVADMEWFYIGERADQFRGYGYPNNFETNYLADASKAYKFINIDFYYSGDVEDVQRSKKTLTIATADDTTLAALWTALGTAEVVETEAP